MSYTPSDYSTCPGFLRDYLYYMLTIKGRSKLTVEGYFIDLRTFFRFLKKYKGLVPEETPLDEISIQDVPLSLAAALTLLGMLLPRLSGLRGELSALLGSAGLTGELFSPLLRVLAAGEITRFTAELCRDSGEKALAVTVELCGAAAAGLALLPLAKRALELIGSIGG